jgi:protein gp37
MQVRNIVRGDQWVERSGWPLPSLWAGTSIESDRYTFRARYLVETPAAVRFVSAEPLLGPLHSLELTGIDWLIVGGESGPGARRMDPGWAIELRDRCAEAGVAFFFKQAGAVLAAELGATHRTGANLAELPKELCVRQMPAGAAVPATKETRYPEAEAKIAEVLETYGGGGTTHVA